jgi:hypothetical protein
MEREPQPERDVEDLEHRADEVEQEIEDARDQAAGTDGVDVESDDEPGDD